MNLLGVERAREGDDSCCGGEHDGEFPVLKGPAIFILVLGFEVNF
jgi:hypothetical protein